MTWLPTENSPSWQHGSHDVHDWMIKYQWDTHQQYFQLHPLVNNVNAHFLSLSVLKPMQSAAQLAAYSILHPHLDIAVVIIVMATAFCFSTKIHVFLCVYSSRLSITVLIMTVSCINCVSVTGDSHAGVEVAGLCCTFVPFAGFPHGAKQEEWLLMLFLVCRRALQVCGSSHTLLTSCSNKEIPRFLEVPAVTPPWVDGDVWFRKELDVVAMTIVCGSPVLTYLLSIARILHCAMRKSTWRQLLKYSVMRHRSRWSEHFRQAASAFFRTVSTFWNYNVLGLQVWTVRASKGPAFPVPNGWGPQKWLFAMLCYMHTPIFSMVQR